MNSPHNHTRLPFVAFFGLALTASTVSAGVNVWTTNGPAARAIQTLAIDPANPATLYAGALIGGVFKSTNSGATWAATGTGLPNQSIYELAIDPSAPATLYAATYGGVFKSTDASARWFASGRGLTNPYVHSIAIDPTNPAILYAGTDSGVGIDSGVFKSGDSGGTWAVVDTGLTRYVSELAIDPLTPATLYAGAIGPEVRKSTDSGRTWAATGPGPNDPYGLGGVYVVAINPANPSILYAATDYLGLFKSTDGGRSWTRIDTGATETVVALAIDPSDPATLYAGTWGGGVFQSFDAGATWTEMNAGLNNRFVYALAVDPATPARIYAGTDNGVYEFLRVEGHCVTSATALCLNGGRFQVTATWATRDGASGNGQASALSGDTGYFWFFGAGNVEVIVKVLNGCGVNSRYWTFAAGLTDVNVILTVTDTQTGAVKTYTNPQGTPFQPIQETNAFACP